MLHSCREPDETNVHKIRPTLDKESPLPLTDPHDAEAQRMLNIPYRIIW